MISSVNFTTIRKTNIYRSKHLVNLNPNTDVLSTSVSFIRDWPFNFQGEFLKKYSDSQCCWKNIPILVEEKKKSDSEFLTYNLMLISGKKICALHEKKKKKF
jgi:hypothetical protein